MTTTYFHRKLQVILSLALLNCLAVWGASEEPANADGPLPISRGELVAFRENVLLQTNETAREIVVGFSSAKILGTVDGDAVVLGGDAMINGKIKHDLVVILGSATLGPDAEVEHDVVVIGGHLNSAPGARIGHQRVVVPLGFGMPQLAWLKDWVVHGALLGRPLPPQVGWAWSVVAVFLLIYFLVAVMLPRPVQSSFEVLQKRPAGSFFSGLLALFLFGPLCFLLIVSVAGILVVPFLLCALVAAVLVGKVAVFRYTGHQLGAQFGAPSLQAPMLAFILGAAIVCLVYMIPILGIVFWGVATLLGLGAVILATFGCFRREVAKTNAPSVPLLPPDGIGPAADPLLGHSFPIDSLTMPRVGFWLRFGATFLDLILLCWMLHFGPLFGLVWVAYHVCMWTWKGTTIGGIITGIKCVRLDGRPLDFGVALVRSLASFFSAIALFLGFFWASWDREKQSWHDKIAGTTIVKVPRGVSLV